SASAAGLQRTLDREEEPSRSTKRQGLERLPRKPAAGRLDARPAGLEVGSRPPWSGREADRRLSERSRLRTLHAAAVGSDGSRAAEREAAGDGARGADRGAPDGRLQRHSIRGAVFDRAPVSE